MSLAQYWQSPSEDKNKQKTAKRQIASCVALIEGRHLQLMEVEYSLAPDRRGKGTKQDLYPLNDILEAQLELARNCNSLACEDHGTLLSTAHTCYSFISL